MSTRSYIAKQIDENTFRTIYCHSDGYLTHNGALLLDYYHSEEQLDKLLALGDLSYLSEKLDPDPTFPHSFKYNERQEGVTVAYGRDRGDKDIEARNFTLSQLNDPNSWVAYIYIFSLNGTWQYSRAGHMEEGFRDVAADLEQEYAYYHMERPEGYYGILNENIAEHLKTEQTLEENKNENIPSCSSVDQEMMM